MNPGFRLLLSPVILTIIFIFLCSIFSTSNAEQHQRNFDTWREQLKAEAIRQGISPKTLDSALEGVEPIQEVIEKDRHQPENFLSLNDYVAKFVTQKRIDTGKEKLRQKRKLLKTVEDRYKVESGLLVALWGVESDFGRRTGRFPTIASLVTLSYDARRSSFFRKELIFALKILDRGLISGKDLRGSWAGALGQLQFMPSTFYKFGVDFDGDGQIKIWDEGLDLFATAANFIHQNGWRYGQDWVTEVLLPDDFDQRLVSLKVTKPQAEWIRLGVQLPADQFPEPSKTLWSIVQANRPGGKKYLVSGNFLAILKWNRSRKFAIAAGLLQKYIAGR